MLTEIDIQMDESGIRIGQIGLGAWGRNLLRNFHGLSGCEVKSACDLDSQTLKRSASSYPGVKFSSKPEEVLEDPEIEAVVIATPPDSHYRFAREALLSGKDVLVEKPFVLDIAEAEELIELAERGGRVLMVGHIMEYHPASLRLKEYLDRGELGRVYYLYASRVNLGKVRETENALWSFAPHDLSLMMFLLGKAPLSVSATGAHYLQPGIEDVAFISLTFEDQIMAHVHVSWLDPHKSRTLTIVGSKKMAVFDDVASGEKIWLYDKGVQSQLDYNTYGEYLSLRTGDIVIPKIENIEPLKAECEHFLECVRERKKPRSDGHDGLRVLKVLDAAQRSLKQGGTPVKLEIGA
jgi:predicted dehydrogenase